jgi:hypothetical protein
LIKTFGMSLAEWNEPCRKMSLAETGDARLGTVLNDPRLKLDKVRPQKRGQEKSRRQPGPLVQ